MEMRSQKKSKAIAEIKGSVQLNKWPSEINERKANELAYSAYRKPPKPLE